MLMQNHDFDESKGTSVRLSKSDRLEVVPDTVCKSEKEALLQTQAGLPSVQERRIHDFCVVDSKGNLEPLESLSFARPRSLKISGLIYPRDGAMTKASGRRVAKFGPIQSYSVGLNGPSVVIRIDTKLATYVAMRPNASYRKSFENLSDQAEIAFEVFKALNPSSGGNINSRFEEVIARLARTKVTKKFSSTREGLLINGRFVLEQLRKAGAEAGGCMKNVAECEFYKALEFESQNYTYVGTQRGTEANRVVIKADSDASNHQVDAQALADQQLAMQLQAKLDREMNARTSNFVGAKDSQAYVKVNEEEIADDYPLPQQYIKEEEEMDEFILYDEEMENLCPEDLPKRILTDYSIYNGDGFLSSLELLPMWSGIDPDVELYASGLIIEGTSDCQIGADASGSCLGSSTKKEQEPNGMRMSLSQIREWVVELGPEMVFISIRTDIGWYSLSVPSIKYKPWAQVVMKCATIASKILQVICEESRASKVSFIDIVKRLSTESKDSKTYISNKVCPMRLIISLWCSDSAFYVKATSVERFLSVHAQILLSCFQHFPMESVRKCGFVSTLKEKLNSLKHSKLYVTSARSRWRGTNRNPMKDRAAGTRAKPMTATATTMIKSVWQMYFNAPKGSMDGDKDIAHEVEEDENEEAEDDATETALASNLEDKAQASEIIGYPIDKLVEKFMSKIQRKESSWSLEDPFSSKKAVCSYSKAKNRDIVISVGDSVKLSNNTIGVVQALWESKNKKLVQIRELKQGFDTVLGDAASDEELFLTTTVETFSLGQLEGKLKCTRKCRAWAPSTRLSNFTEDAKTRQDNEIRKTEKKGIIQTFWCKEYVPEEGMFRDAPKDLKLGTILSEDEDEEEEEYAAIKSNKGVIIHGTQYELGDFMYVGPEVFDQMPEAKEEVELPSYLSNSRYHKGSYSGLRAWGIGRLVRGRRKEGQSPRAGPAP